MKIPNGIKFFVLNSILVFSCFSNSLMHASAEPISPEHDMPATQKEEDAQTIPPEFEKEIKKMQEDFLESKLKPTLQCIERIDFILEHLAQVVNNQQINKCVSQN